MNKEEFIGKLQMVYVGDRNAFNEIVEDNQKLKNELVYSKVEINRLNNIIKELSKDVDMWNKKYNEQFDIINELEKWIKERYKKTEENSSRMKVITSLNREFYITVKNVQSDRKDVLDKLKELKENNK